MYGAVLSVIAGMAFGVVIAASTLGVLGLPVPGFATCEETPPIELNGTTYWACNATIPWSNGGLWPSSGHAFVSFHGLTFDIYGYTTIECPVVNVTGHEPGGPTYSFLIYPVPFDCQYTQPTVLSPDQDFGATWSGGSSIELLVRAG